MARVNITVPDELLSSARTAGLNVSRLASSALAEELDRRAKIAQLDAYLAELEDELGPLSANELADAATWADQIAPIPEPSLSASRAKPVCCQGPVSGVLDWPLGVGVLGA